MNKAKLNYHPDRQDHQDRQDRQDRRLVILGDLDDLDDLCWILHFFTSIIFPLHISNILIEKKQDIAKKKQIRAKIAKIW